MMSTAMVMAASRGAYVFLVRVRKMLKWGREGKLGLVLGHWMV